MAVSDMWASIVQETIDGAKTQKPHEILLDGVKSKVGSPWPSPKDWRDQWIYLVMTDRFNNPKAPPNQLNNWDNSVFTDQGGKFKGITQQLDYLQNLGVGAIWITPVLKNPAYHDGTFSYYHGYAPYDFFNIDPRFAVNSAKPEKELRDLIDKAHKKGIYVIFDIVLHHAANVFSYNVPSSGQYEANPARQQTNPPYTPYSTLAWTNPAGQPEPTWSDVSQVFPAPLEALVWPRQLQKNEYFTRLGNVTGDIEVRQGDFNTLKQLDTQNQLNVRDILIRSCQYLISKYDPDGFRLDALKHMDPGFSRIFTNAIREYTAMIGKTNFFMFGEVVDSEKNIADFVSNDPQHGGVDSAQDFPLKGVLVDVIKGNNGITPRQLAQIYWDRQAAEQGKVTSHGEASNFFLVFIDDQDDHFRFFSANTTQDQLTLALTCLFGLQGIPCVYYGTEQGLYNADITSTHPEPVRQALWGKGWTSTKPTAAFGQKHPIYATIKSLSEAYRGSIGSAFPIGIPALRYGRQYFREVSGNKINFDFSDFPQGIIAFSRILADTEVVVVANPSIQPPQGQQLENIAILIDPDLNKPGTNPVNYKVVYSNKPGFTQPDPVAQAIGPITVGGRTPTRETLYLTAHLQPLEAQILLRAL